MTFFKKIVGSILAATTAVAIGVATFSNVDSLTKANADNTYTLTLNSSNSPTISGGSGTMVDEKGVTWEYSNVSDYNNGHITLNHQGYFGVSDSTTYGFTGIAGITANFSSTNELWLLKSVDGITWSEEEILVSGELTNAANGWRFVRFYNWSDNNTSININSVQIRYSCSGISPTEDVDGAKYNNVVSVSSNLTYAAEYNDISPNSIGGEAVSFAKTSNAKTEIIIGFGKTYTVGSVQNSKVEFDMKTTNINYGKSIQLVKDSSGFGTSIDSSKHSAYKCTNIQDDWYHIEVPITAFISTISGYGTQDLPVNKVETKEINGIKINAGTCIIDNLRVSASSCDLGNCNNPTWVPAVGDFFWVKTSWVGKLYPEQVSMTFSDDTLARHVPITDPNIKHGSPFYIELLDAGTVTITITVVSGHNRRVQTIQHTITIN